MYTITFFNNVLTTLLRLRGNAVIVGTVGFPDEETFALASARGLYIAEHHITPLGVNCYAWPKGVPYSYRLNPRVFSEVWGSLAAFQCGRRMLWTVGMRGLWDEPFW